MGPKEISFQWTNQGAHLSTMIQKIFNKNVFCDVTLVCDDQTQIQAHKLILASSSPVLENILLNNPHPHPLLYLRGIKSKDMKNILNFIYFGEVTLLQKQVGALLDVANELQIKELRTKNANEKDEDKSDPLSELSSAENEKEGFCASASSEHNGNGQFLLNA